MFALDASETVVDGTHSVGGVPGVVVIEQAAFSAMTARAQGEPGGTALLMSAKLPSAPEVLVVYTWPSETRRISTRQPGIGRFPSVELPMPLASETIWSYCSVPLTVTVTGSKVKFALGLPEFMFPALSGAVKRRSIGESMPHT